MGIRVPFILPPHTGLSPAQCLELLFSPPGGVKDATFSAPVVPVPLGIYTKWKAASGQDHQRGTILRCLSPVQEAGAQAWEEPVCVHGVRCV